MFRGFGQGEAKEEAVGGVEEECEAGVGGREVEICCTD